MKRTPERGLCPNYRPKLPTPQGESVKTIPLGDGYCAYVDAADYEWLSQWKWRFQGGYAVRWTKNGIVYMHREIMKPPPGMVVDHKSRNKLDNTRENLRNATRRENQRNTGKRHGTSSRFKGVGYCKARDKYQAHIQCKGRLHCLGFFIEETDAARAYDRAAVELFGEFARLNFPEEWPPERRQEVYAQRDAAQKDKGKSEKENKKTETGRRKAEGRGRKTGETKDGKRTERKAKSERATGPKPRATKAKGQKQRRTRPAEKKTRGMPGNS
jgi:hypothetical protein